MLPDNHADPLRGFSSVARDPGNELGHEIGMDEAKLLVLYQICNG